jgi:hypothetical protein
VSTLLHLFRGSLGVDTHPISASLDNGDWTELGQLAKAHGVVPWMLVHLPAASVKALPEDLASDWQAWEQQNRLRVLANWAVAIRVLGVVESAGMRALPIKGVALSQQLYRDPWMRPAGDVDVLIERRMVPAAHAAMLGAGFVPEDVLSRITDRQWRWLLNNALHACYRDRQSGILVELHWRMHGNGLLNNLDESWIVKALDSGLRRNDGKEVLDPRLRGDDISGTEVLGRRVLVLSAPVLYLLTMSHLARSRWSRLLWVLDSWKALQAARAVCSEAELEAVIEKHGATRLHQRFLRLMRYVLEDEGLDQWPPPEFGASYEHMRSWTPVRRGWDELRFHLGLKGAPSYKLSVLRGYLVAPCDFSVLRLPDWLFWLYVPLRVPLFIYRRYFQRNSAGATR